jgi:hypothetical protein
MQNGFKTFTFLFALGFSAILAAAPSPEQARAIAKDAYIFSYPLVMNYRTMYMQAIKGDGRFGKWLHLGLSSPADTDIVTPNNDTPYSLCVAGLAVGTVGADDAQDRIEAVLHQPVG